MVLGITGIYGNHFRRGSRRWWDGPSLQLYIIGNGMKVNAYLWLFNQRTISAGCSVTHIVQKKGKNSSTQQRERIRGLRSEHDADGKGKRNVSSGKLKFDNHRVRVWMTDCHQGGKWPGPRRSYATGLESASLRALD